jgi:hypothetical protein
VAYNFESASSSFTKLGIADYDKSAGDPGLHLDNRNNLASDILFIKKETLPPTAFSEKYISVPALLHIENRCNR